MAKFYGIGVGPGDPDLLTIKAAKVLAKIDVLLVPENKKGKNTNIAYDIAKSHINEKAEIIYVEFPMVRDLEIFSQAGKAAADIVAENVAKGRNVAFVTLGDTAIYSTYGYIVKNMPDFVEIETIPGITSFCASAAATNRQLVESEEIFAVIPATASEDKIKSALEVTQSVAFMKVYKDQESEKVIKNLESKNLLQDSVIVKRCSFPDAEIREDVKETLREENQYLSVVLTRKG